MIKLRTISIVGLAALISGVTGFANAQGRPDSRRMTCDQAYDLVKRHGAVVMSTGRYTFERVVADRRWCQFEEVTQRFYVPTLDYDRCRVGYKCIPGNIYDRN